MSSSERRRFLKAAGACGAAVLGGCGFELRRNLTMPFSSIALQGFVPRSPMAQQLRQGLKGVQVLEVPAQADVVLRALNEERVKVASGTTTASQVNTFSLRLRFKFRVETPAGRELIGTSELGLARDMSYSETHTLAKEYEEEDLYRAMQADIAEQVLRRLAAIRL